MELLDLMKERYSVRAFADRPVEEEKIGYILEAGRIAPTAHNNQPCRIRVIRSEAAREALKKCTACHYNAPLAFLVTYVDDECWKREYDGHRSGDVDASIVTTHMMLAAAEQEIGTCWVMYFIPEAVKTEFELPCGETPAAILLAGYPADKAAPSPRHAERKSKAETVIEL